ncbi:VC1465 family Xer recombination activation factor [[Acidovorax] ebreus]|uniref:Uncharacterized protein n=1 Tax=Acidovorax ebreus (strain TPSY) TaxID=535289 RepID=A0A9J9UAU7_ACIET|nr:hypothetical protein Dtpsy_1868 [[Acidovorax] ebreus TPSY]
MRLNLGWDRATCAKNFHVTERTLHNWETGKNDIPYTAYRLLRLLNGMELPGESWAGWYFAGGTLYTPEGYPLTGKDGSWWSLLVRRAAMFDEMVRGRGGATAAGGMRSVSPAGGAAPGPTAPAGGRREAPALDLSHKHFRTRKEKTAVTQALPLSNLMTMGYGAAPHVLIPQRSVPPTEGATPPARLRVLLQLVPPAPAASDAPWPGYGPPRGTQPGLTPMAIPRPGKQRRDYVDNLCETINSGGR